MDAFLSASAKSIYQRHLVDYPASRLQRRSTTPGFVTPITQGFSGCGGKCCPEPCRMFAAQPQQFLLSGLLRIDTSSTSLCGMDTTLSGSSVPCERSVRACPR